MRLISQSQLKEIFEYKNGMLLWRVFQGNSTAGKRAGTLRKDNYRQVGINKTIHYKHRLIFLYHRGYMPKEIDHIDGNPKNNHIENLREVTHSQNQRNMKKCLSVSSKYKGVSWSKRDKRWTAFIYIENKNKNLGSFDSETEAAKAYNKAARAIFGEYSLLNNLVMEA